MCWGGKKLFFRSKSSRRSKKIFFGSKSSRGPNKKFFFDQNVLGGRKKIFFGSKSFRRAKKTFFHHMPDCFFAICYLILRVMMVRAAKIIVIMRKRIVILLS